MYLPYGEVPSGTVHPRAGLSARETKRKSMDRTACLLCARSNVRVQREWPSTHIKCSGKPEKLAFFQGEGHGLSSGQRSRRWHLLLDYAMNKPQTRCLRTVTTCEIRLRQRTPHRILIAHTVFFSANLLRFSEQNKSLQPTASPIWRGAQTPSASSLLSQLCS